jgi:hypothetical protein
MFAQKVFDIIVEVALTYHNIVVDPLYISCIKEFYQEDGIAALYAEDGLKIVKESLKKTIKGDLIVEDNQHSNYISKSSGYHSLFEQIQSCSNLDEVSLFTGIPRSVLTHDISINEVDLSGCNTLTSIKDDIVGILDKFAIEYRQEINEEQEYHNIIREFIKNELQ